MGNPAHWKKVSISGGNAIFHGSKHSFSPVVMPTIVPFDTLTDLYTNLSKKYAGQNKAGFHHKLDASNGYEPVYWDQITEDVQAIAGYLASKGIKNGDPVGILSENRYEWAVVDLAIQLIGGINVSFIPPCLRISVNIFYKIHRRKYFCFDRNSAKKAVEVFENCSDLKEVLLKCPKIKN